MCSDKFKKFLWIQYKKYSNIFFFSSLNKPSVKYRSFSACIARIWCLIYSFNFQWWLIFFFNFRKITNTRILKGKKFNSVEEISSIFFNRGRIMRIIKKGICNHNKDMRRTIQAFSLFLSNAKTNSNEGQYNF